MNLLRGWERQYLPAATGGIRLATPAVYQSLGEEEGVGDAREGELRVSQTGSIESSGPEFLPPVDFEIQTEPGAPPIVVPGVSPGETRTFEQAIHVKDHDFYPNPFLHSLSREPSTPEGWHSLRSSLPERYDAWTRVADVAALQFEVECGLKRWMALNEITKHQLTRFRGWIAYSYDTIPAPLEPSDINQASLLQRWLNKRRRYQDQQEYRLGWVIRSPQLPTLPNSIDIELTRTGLALFEPWDPPGE